MGARHLVLVYYDGEYKVAQYGQYDGYPENAGLDTLRFVRKLMAENQLISFCQKVRAIREVDEKYLEQLRQEPNWFENHPEFNRTTGSGILSIILERAHGLRLPPSDLDFAADSLFCEWAWLLDLDNQTFEAYMGFNKRPLTPEDRFYFLRDRELETRGYHAVVLAASWPFANLPSDKEFLAALQDSDSEEEDLDPET